jgi:hypothetical protein
MAAAPGLRQVGWDGVDDIALRFNETLDDAEAGRQLAQGQLNGAQTAAERTSAHHQGWDALHARVVTLSAALF